MNRKLDINKIIKDNKGVDKKLFEKSRDQLEKLRGFRAKDTGYNLGSPFTRTLRQVAGDDYKDRTGFYTRI